MQDTETFRIFSLILYDENDQFNQVFQKVLKNDYSYIYILHDKDNVKPHYHFVLYFTNPTTINKISKALDLPPNLINTFSIDNNVKKRYTMKQTISYLIHFKMDDKFNYSFDEIKTNIPIMCKKYYNILTNNKEDSREISEIIAFIDDNFVHDIRDVIHFCIENGYLNTLKKYQYVIIQYIRSSY